MVQKMIICHEFLLKSENLVLFLWHFIDRRRGEKVPPHVLDCLPLLSAEKWDLPGEKSGIYSECGKSAIRLCVVFYYVWVLFYNVLGLTLGFILVFLITFLGLYSVYLLLNQEVC